LYRFSQSGLRADVRKDGRVSISITLVLTNGLLRFLQIIEGGSHAK